MMKTAGFYSKDGRYYCEQLPLVELAEEYGTPLYVYSKNYLLNRYQELVKAVNDPQSLVCFAVKSNSNLAILQLLAREGSGFDIVSGGELARVLEAGGDPQKIVYSGVGKTRSEQRAALEAGIATFNVESFPEFKQLDQLAGELGLLAPVAIRVNPEVDARTHHKITTGKKENKFGIPLNLIEQAARQVVELDNLQFMGLHFHIGSQITSSDPFERLGQRAVDLLNRLETAGIEVKTLNIGGGLGVCYDQEETLTPERWLQAVRSQLGSFEGRLLIEPGRYLTAGAGALLTSVVYYKPSVNKNFAIVDAGMNSLLRPAMYDAYHRIVPAVERSQQPSRLDVVGPICETGDTLGKDRLMPPPEPGDCLAVLEAGAYGASMASQYNSFPRPAEILVDQTEVQLIRRPETYQDLWAKERLIEQ